MTYTQALEYIHGLHRFGRKPELRRMELLLQKLGDPQKQLRFVHVAGTNGKGSTSAMLSSILRAAGYRTGTYTSPFVIDFCERIVLDGEMIDRAALAALVEEVAQKAAEVEQAYESPREFEFITAVALLYYARQGCDIVVLEVGLGGRFDATNIIPTPLVAVICPIGLDHMELLGHTLAAIAYEKCGIIKEGCVVVASPEQPREALEVIFGVCHAQHCPLALPQLPQLTIQDCTTTGSSFVYHDYPFRLPLVGPHQVRNAITAIDTALALGGMGISIGMAQIAEGLSHAYIPGRMEVFVGKPTVILDGAHNPHGMAALRESLLAAGVQGVTAVVGMLADKSCAEALEVIAPYLREIVVTQPQTSRALPAHKLAALVQNYCSHITIEPDSQKALGLAMRSGCNTVLVFGSLYLVSEVRPMLV